MREELMTVELPLSLKLNRQESIAYLKDRGVPEHMWKTSRRQLMTVLQDLLLQTHRHDVGCLLEQSQKWSESYLSPVTIRHPCTSIAVILNTIQQQHVRIQLQELFMLLCSYKMETATKYQANVRASTWCKSSIHLPSAQLFVYLLVGQSADNVSACVNALMEAFSPRIPVLAFSRLVDLIERGATALVQDLTRESSTLVTTGI